MTDPFTGQARLEIVRQLVDAFERVKGGSGSLVAVLCSPPGWGKTRIVHELYRELANQQQDPPYWPESIFGSAKTGSADIDGLLRARKVTYPVTMTVPEKAKMEWMWWGVSCAERKDGGLYQAIFEDAGQIQAHSYGLTRASVPDVAGHGFDVSSTVIGLLGLLGLGLVPPVGIAITVAGAAKTVWDKRELPERVKKFVDARGAAGKRRSIDIRSGVGRQDEMEEIVDGLSRLTQEMPTVIIVDDAHFGDDRLRQVIDGVVRRKESRVLVVATAWPSHLDQHDTALPFCEWARAFSDEQPDRYMRIDLDQLSVADIEQIVREELPAAAPFSQTLLHLYGSNVLVIRGVLRLDRVRRMAEEDDLTDEALEELPRDVEGVFAEHWKILPAEVRKTLSLAAQAPDIRYLPEVVAAAWETRGLMERAREHVAEGIDPYAWAREIDLALHSFIEPVLHDVARSRGKELLTPKDVAALREGIVNAACSIDSLELSAPAREELLRQHVILVRERLAPVGVAAARSARLLADLDAQRYAYKAAIELAELAIEWNPSLADTEACEARSALACLFGKVGRTGDAIRIFEELLPDVTRVLGPEHPDSFTARNNLACSLGEAGRADEAIAMYQRLLADQTSVLGVEHTDTLVTRHNLAWSIGASGRTDEAIRLFDGLLTDRARLLGPDHPDTLTTRNGLAIFLRESGHQDQAIRMLEDVLADRTRVLGADHVATFVTRSGLARAVGEAGRVKEAIRMYDELLPDQIRVLGADHPETLSTRNALGYFLRESGQLNEAVSMLEELLADQTRILGSDHPKTFTTRNNLLAALRDAGRTVQLIRMYEDLVADRNRVLGADHPDTLIAQNNLASSLRTAGRTDEAIQMHAAILADRIRVLGADHRDTLITRSNLASALGSAGRIDEAVAMDAELLADRTRVLGQDHVDTLVTRNNLAWSLGKVDRLEEAISMYEELIPDQTRVLGADHAGILTIRSNLATFLGKVDRLEEAISMYEELIPDLTRALGPDHHHTLTIRNNLAISLKAAGRTNEATRMYEELISDLTRVLGPEHPTTKGVQNGLGALLR